MNKVKQMLENLEKELRANKQYSAADKLLPIIEEAKTDKQKNVCLQIQKVLIEHDIEPLGDLANGIFDIILKEE